MRPPGKRGSWHLLSLLSPVLMLFGLAGLLGPDLRAESETALGDWARLAQSPVVRVACLVLLVVAVVAVVMLSRSL